MFTMMSFPAHIEINRALASGYPDIQGHWASSYIQSLSQRQIVTGYPDGSFKPEQTVTRAQFTSMVVRALQLPIRSTSDFPDTAGHWAAGFLTTARLYGIIDGFPDGLVHPDEQVTRAQMAAMFVRALHLTQTGNDFPDTANHWARSSIQKIAAYSFMTGLPGGTFGPDQAATRAQAAAVIVRVLDNRPKTVLGYSVRNYSTDMNSLRSIEQFGDSLSHIASFRYTIDASGHLLEIEEGNQDMHVAEARNQGLLPLLSVHNDFNATLVGDLLKSDSSRANLIRNLSATIEQKNYVGVNIDLENIPRQYKNQLNQLMRDLRNELHHKGYLVTIAVPAKQSDTPTNSSLDAYDYELLGEYADLVVIMTYDEHWFGGQPGPIASIDWTEQSLQYASAKIPKDKLLLGIAAYGYDWPDTPGVNGKAVTSYSLSKLLAQYGGQTAVDANAKETTYSYTDENGVNHTVWIQDAASLPSKLELADKYAIRGIGIWRLGLENQAFWQALQTSWH
jgi:spore germination protein YaaH